MENNTEHTVEGFELLAIRPLKDCPPSLLKALKEGEIYQFNNCYTFTRKNPDEINSEILSVKPEGSWIQNLYGNNNLNISISSVVGKNGSGKSSLFEIIYAFTYLLGTQCSLPRTQKKLIDPIQSVNPIDELNTYEDISVVNKLSCEIYFRENENIHRFICSEGKIDLELLKNEKDGCRWQGRNKDLSEYCYILALNYSLYGINDKYYPWLFPLFHKNDLYQTPLVINPFRSQGVINVNRENELSQARTLLNFINIDFNSPTVINDKVVSALNFRVDCRTNDSLRINDMVHVGFWTIGTRIEEKGKTCIDIFDTISKAQSTFSLKGRTREQIKKLFEDDKKLSDLQSKESSKKYLWSEKQEAPNYINIQFEMIKYVVRKTFKIAVTHPAIVGIGEKGLREPKEIVAALVENVDTIIRYVCEDNTHVTLKIRQALNFLQNEYLKDVSWKKIRNSQDLNYYDYGVAVELAELNNLFTSLSSYKLDYKKKLNLIPGGLIKTEVLVKTPSKESNEHSVETLSSGEQQMINALNTIQYHLANLASAHHANDNRVRYRNITILFDEIELYFHPDFQRKLVSDLVHAIKNLKLDGIKNLHIILSTHSPFILSDISATHVLRLDNGNPVTSVEEKTFGANIHDMLANDFFLRDGFMGSFAQKKIDELILSLEVAMAVNQSEKMNYEYLIENFSIELLKKHPNLKNRSFSEKTELLSKAECESLINMIGEPVLYMSLMELYSEAFQTAGYAFLDEQINELQKLRDQKKS